MLSLFKFSKRNLKTQKVAGQLRGFDRSYYVQTSGKKHFRDFDFQNSVKESYISNVIAYRSVSMLSKAVASIHPLYFMENDTKSINNIEEIELPKHNAIQKLLNSPSPVSDREDFIYSIIANYCLSGNAYVQVIRDKYGMPIELYSLRPDRIEILQGINVIPEGYRYKVDSAVIDFIVDQNSGFCEILHIKNFHPLDDWEGLSSLDPAYYAIEQHNECMKWNKALLENGARPSGALVVNQKLTKEQHERLKNSMEDVFSGGINAGKTMVLEGGIDWKEMGVSPKDMEFLEMKNSCARDIAMAFGVPAQLLGIQGDNTYSNMSEARIAFWEDSVIPIAEMIYRKFSNWFGKMYGKNINIKIDLDRIPALTEKRVKFMESTNNADFIDRNEKREMMDFENNKIEEKIPLENQQQKSNDNVVDRQEENY